ncbi:polymer-forming cytoskeletal protein [Pseudodesulfovibrio cashew]|uniref:Polymer-forming cytoskeletal protein n=1 Tax=Pseudodesulfovibrio cashew TaxID=2678688 RepID=A0A6I6JGR9_9BACT|nr:polymer-forming cytoskeletal protein [Pseudodesulfovibrio cashew]QGY39703.1 polymer-forming cytoskeletal protein [Pseudodesulfovibrio cashew]
MGLFGSKQSDNTELNAFLGVGTEYKGKLDFVGTVRIDGQFEGEISTDGDLILGRKASIIGKIRVGRLTSCGRIEGEVTVKERAVLEKTSVLNGSLSTPALVVEQGAVMEGNIVMTKEGVAAGAKVVAADFGAKATRDDAPETPIAKTGSGDSIL